MSATQTFRELTYTMRPQDPHGDGTYTSDLIDLLHVLGRLVALEPAQADLLGRICASTLLNIDTIRLAGALANPDENGPGKASA